MSADGVLQNNFYEVCKQGDCSNLLRLLPLCDPRANNSWGLALAVFYEQHNVVEILAPLSDLTHNNRWLWEHLGNEANYHSSCETIRALARHWDVGWVVTAMHEWTTQQKQALLTAISQDQRQRLEDALTAAALSGKEETPAKRKI